MTGLNSLAGSVSIVPSGPSSNGYHSPAEFDGFSEEPQGSDLLKLLPAIYSADPFVGRFLRIFEDVLNPVSEMVDNQPYYFDPLTAPLDLLGFMADWVDLTEGDDWTLHKRRTLVDAAASLYRMRGTKEGIKRHLGIYAGGIVLVLERTQGFTLDADARLGLNTVIGEHRPRAFNVTVVVPNPSELDVDTIRNIIETDKPVETSYVLRVLKLPIREKKRGRKRAAR